MKLKTRCLLLAAAVALTGCVQSMTAIRSGGATQTYTSEKPAEDLAKCVLFAWQDTSLAGSHALASIQPGRSGGVTVLTQGNEYFVDIEKQGAGSKAAFYQASETWISKKLRPGITGCL